MVSCSKFLALVALTIAAVVADTASTTTSIPTPATNPKYPTDYPIGTSLAPRTYPDFNQNFTCINFKRFTFNLAQKPHCGTPDAQDYYGYGVRIGFYTTWFGAWFAGVWLREEISGAIDANSIFLLALEIATLKTTFYDHELLRVDAVVLLLVGMGTTVGALSLWGYRTVYWRNDPHVVQEDFGGIGTYTRVLLCFCLNLYGLWFWKEPFKQNLSFADAVNCDPRCWTAYVFGVRVSSGIRWLFFTFNLLWEIYWGLVLVFLIIALVPSYRKTLRTYVSSLQDSISARVRKRLRLGDNAPLPKWTARILPIANLLWFIFMITLIEITLNENSALGTLAQSPESTSAAQLVPFLIGIFSLARLIWKKLQEVYLERKDKIDPRVKCPVCEVDLFIHTEATCEECRASLQLPAATDSAASPAVDLKKPASA